jgi:aspartate oxidase
MRDVPLDDIPTAPDPDPSNRRSSGRQDDTQEPQLAVAGLRDQLQRDMTTFAGVLRDGPGLERAARAVAAVDAERPDALEDGRAAAELGNLVVVARAVVTAAAEREESRGCHYRLDFPEPRQPLERIVHFGPDRRVRVRAAAAVSEREG